MTNKSIRSPTLKSSAPFELPAFATGQPVQRFREIGARSFRETFQMGDFGQLPPYDCCPTAASERARGTIE